VNRRKGRGDEP